MNKVFSNMFLWMFAGLLLTFGVGYAVSLNEVMFFNIFNQGKYMLIWIAELVVVIVLATRIRKMEYMTSIILFLLYSGLTGLTLSSIFILYELESIIWIFLVTSVVFFIFAMIGKVTNVDLTKIGTFLFMAIIGILLVSIINVFVDSVAIDLGLAIISIIVFIAFIAYDIQLVKKNIYGIDDERKLAIYGAFQLYLDFINIFLDLLRLFANRRD